MIELQLYEDIDAFVARALVARIKDAKDRDILLRIHSGGGSILDGYLIFNALKAHRGQVVVQIDGLAASMAAIIALAGHEVRMADNGFLMLHAPSVPDGGNVQDLARSLKALQQIEAQFKEILTQKIAAKKAQEYLNGQDHWLDAREALATGLIDKIVPAIGVAIALHKAYVAAVARKQETYFFTQNTQPMNEKIRQQAIAALGEDFADTRLSTEALITALADKHKEAQSRYEALKKRAREEEEARIKTVLKAAVADRKITQAQSGVFEHISRSAGIAALTEALQTITPAPCWQGK